MKRSIPRVTDMGIKIDADRLVIYGELLQIYGIPYSKTHLLRLERAGKFPPRVALSSRRVAWKARELALWVRNLNSIDARD